jgi:hypothetical protein
MVAAARDAAEVANVRARTRLLMLGAAAAAALGAGTANAGSIFTGDLAVSSLTYEGSQSTVTTGQNLPNCTAGVCVKATADGKFGDVFQNDVPDSNFGVTAPYSIQFYRTTKHGATLKSVYNVPDASFTGSFSSKSEGAINLSADHKSLTLLGYNSGVNQIDISNANTAISTETGNTDTAPVTDRTVAQINSSGTTQFTNTYAYSGNNGRAVILASDGNYYMAGNGGNGNGDGNIGGLTGVQRVAPGGGPSTTETGTINPATYGLTDKKPFKENNFRGETVFDNTIYVTKGSGSNGINSVFQVGTAGSLPTSGSTITVLPGFTTGTAKSDTNFFPFGIWFANANTLYVGDEGDGAVGNGDVNAGLQKWSKVGGVWQQDYTLQAGLDIGTNYTVTGTDAAGDSGSYTTSTDGLRNITGKVNKDGTVTIYAVTSTASVGTGDQGADPDKVVAITDTLSFTHAADASGESFQTLRTAQYGQVFRGVALTPTPEPATWAMMLLGVCGLGGALRRRRLAVVRA